MYNFLVRCFYTSGYFQGLILTLKSIYKGLLKLHKKRITSWKAYLNNGSEIIGPDEQSRLATWFGEHVKASDVTTASIPYLLSVISEEALITATWLILYVTRCTFNWLLGLNLTMFRTEVTRGTLWKVAY